MKKALLHARKKKKEKRPDTKKEEWSFRSPKLRGKKRRKKPIANSLK